MAIGDQACDQVDQKVDGAAMAGMLCDPFFLNRGNTGDERQGRWS